MIRILLCAAALVVSTLSYGQAQTKISLIPQPVSLEEGSGVFKFDNNTAIEITSDDKDLQRVADYLSKKLSVPTGYPVKVNKVNAFSNGNIHLQYASAASGNKEAYTLTVDPSSIKITSDSAAGIFYGIQTLLQLFPAQIESKKQVNDISWQVPAVAIKDQPRFGWRGTMLDVSRHFFTKQQVKDFIDNIVKYKFNRFHWHLTDDQGWRIEIKSLPKLTEIGAWRPERTGKWANTPKPSPSEPKNYGGFYTQNDIREVIQYAKDRFVEIIPEVDVPGHSLAAIASYPELACTPGNYYVSVGDKIMDWHSKGFSALIDNNLCPANEKVYTFLDKVFTEVAALFPFEYIHMGGDECAKNFWEKSSQVKALMQKEGLKDMHEVQSYFVKRVEKIIKSKGKKLIGWDEILEGGLPEDATVMSWRGMKGGIQAAKAGHKVVMSPSTNVYVDLMQGDAFAEPSTYAKVLLTDAYKFDPVPEGVDPKLILGGQCNLWTEQIQNMRHAQYMLWPRGLAVAESIWSPKEKKDWKSFISRVEHEFDRMDAAEIKYARSMYDPVIKTSREGNQIKLDMRTEIEGLDIYYSYDGSFPDKFYPKYTKPLLLPKDAAEVKIVTYRDGKQVGKQISMPVADLEKRLGK